MVTLEQLRKQKTSLQKLRDTERERNTLKKEIRDLRNPNTTAFKKNLSKGIRTGGRATLRVLDNLTRPVPVRRRRRK